MTTAKLSAPAADGRPMAGIINEALQGQPTESPLDVLDRCDRCGAEANSLFKYAAADVMLCGHHMRMHLRALLSQNPSEF